MNQYITGAMIRSLREKKGLTQCELAKRLCVSDKTVSKWETGKGYPDISLLEPIARELGVSVAELLSGNEVCNTNRSANMIRSSFYVCPICGNVVFSIGESVISCHGVDLLPLEVETPDDEHRITVEPVEDDYYITIDHSMTREHNISFIAGITYDGVNILKLYPEENAQKRLKKNGLRAIFFYCNRDGLFKISAPFTK